MSRKKPHRRKPSRPPLQQHDAFFRKMMAKPAVIEELLQARLPSAFLQEFPISSIEVMPTAFVDSQLNSAQADMVLRLTSSAQQPAYILVALEHQTKPDRHLPFRLWGYMVDIVRQHLREANSSKKTASHQDKSEHAESSSAGNPLKPILGQRDYPPVIPLVYYTGKQSPYPYSMAIRDLFPDSVATELMFADTFPLVDVALLPDDEMLTHQHLAFYEFVVKCIITHNMNHLLEGLRQLPVDRAHLMDIRGLAWQYIAYNLDDHNHDFFAKLNDQFPELKGETMSYAEHLIQQGYEKGIEQGITQGVQENSRQIALQMLKLNLAMSIITQATGLSESEVLVLRAKQ